MIFDIQTDPRESDIKVVEPICLDIHRCGSGGNGVVLIEPRLAASGRKLELKLRLLRRVIMSPILTIR